MKVKIRNSKMLWPHWWQAQTAILLLYIPTKSAYESHTKELSRVELYLWTHTSLLQPTHNSAFWQDFVCWQFIYWPSLYVWQTKSVKFCDPYYDQVKGSHSFSDLSWSIATLIFLFTWLKTFCFEMIFWLQVKPVLLTQLSCRLPLY